VQRADGGGVQLLERLGFAVRLERAPDALA